MSSWGNAVLLDPVAGIAMVNETEVNDTEIMGALRDQHPALMSEMATLSRWVSNTQRPSSRGGIFERDHYVTPRNPFDQMRLAQEAAESDNIVSGVLETTEGLAFSRMAVECLDLDEMDVWNQIINDIDLDSRFREMWGELFTVSQVYLATWWGRKTYKVGGRSPKTDVKRKKVFGSMEVPVALTVLDPLKILPVGSPMFGQERLCWIADREEGRMIAGHLDGDRNDDQIIANLIIGEYQANDQERQRLAELGFATHRLFVLNPQYVWRHTLTRSAYKRFADVRMKAIFPLLDTKNQLRELDRTWLLGGTNFIVLVKRGDKDNPARPEEVSSLQAQVRTMAKVPLIVSDHRLSIEIITPDVDLTLDESRHDLVDNRIAARLLGTFSPTGQVGSDDSVKLARVVALGLESRRTMMKKAFEKHVLKATFDRNQQFKEDPKLVFYPHRIALDFDADLATYILDLRDRGDISRETMLNQIDLNQLDEFYKRKMEKDLGFDDTFETQVPFSTPVGGGTGGAASRTGARNAAKPATNADKRSAGRNQGGNRNGGGRAPGTGQGKKKSTATEEDDE